MGTFVGPAQQSFMSLLTDQHQQGKQMPVKSHSSKYPSWKDLRFWSSPEWKSIQRNLKVRRVNELIPQPRFVFRPLMTLHPKDVRIIIIGKEPFALRPPGESDGYAYSSSVYSGKNGMMMFPTVQQALFSELMTDLEGSFPKHGSLLKWVNQGVLLWNWTPTVSQGVPGSHLKWGWDRLSQEIIETIYLNNPDVIFVPWGVPQTTWQGMLPAEALVINTRGPMLTDNTLQFFGTRPFSKINTMIKDYKLGSPINWNTNF